MVLLPLFYQILVLFCIVLIGMVIYRLKIIDDQGIVVLTRLVMDVTVPALIIVSMNYDFSREMLWETGVLFILSTLIYLGSWFFSLGLTRVCKIGEPDASVYEFMLTFPNVGFMGYPVIDAIYGKMGVFYTSIFNLSFSFLVWTMGVWMFKRNAGEKMSFNWRVLLTPGIAATFLGFLIFLFSIKLPFPIFRTLDLLGGVTTPLSMLIVGTLMGRSKLSQIWSNIWVYGMTAIRLLLIPVVVLVLMRQLNLSATMVGVSVVLAGMPAAANTAIFAAHYGGNAELASKCVFISTMISLGTLPLMVLLMNIT